jgi:pSer/pThr/pTyr-binding forkhead associated (FHA) protein
MREPAVSEAQAGEEAAARVVAQQWVLAHPSVQAAVKVLATAEQAVEVRLATRAGQAVPPVPCPMQRTKESLLWEELLRISRAMRVILEVQGGPQSGRQIILHSGQVAQIGRSPSADLAFPEDSFMSGMHCVVQCGVKVLWVCDHNSTNGVLVNGTKVPSGSLKSGDGFVVGRTHFTVRTCEDDDDDSVSASKVAGRSLINVLRGELQPLYAILDAARDKSILPLLRESSPEYQSLFEGPRGAKLAPVAPYLVRIPTDSPLINTFASEGFSKSWGVFLTCERPLTELRNHLRRFVTVTLPPGERNFFRFYDPRVLRKFMPVTDAKDAKDFFGPIKNFLVEDEKPGEYLRFSLGNEGLVKTSLTLSAS